MFVHAYLGTRAIGWTLGTTELCLQLHSYFLPSACLSNITVIHLFNIGNSVLPGIAFSLDLIETTQQYGVAEVLISSFMAAFVFSVFGAQPLTIAGVTGVS